MPRRGTARRSENSDTLRVPLDVLVPQDLQRDVLALQLAMNLGPVGFRMAAVSLLGADGAEEPHLQRRVGQFCRQRPAKPGRCQSL